MPPPVVFPCGHPGEPPCPPVPAVATTNEIQLFTLQQMQEHGQSAYAKGQADALATMKELDA